MANGTEVVATAYADDVNVYAGLWRDILVQHYWYSFWSSSTFGGMHVDQKKSLCWVGSGVGVSNGTSGASPGTTALLLPDAACVAPLHVARSRGGLPGSGVATWWLGPLSLSSPNWDCWSGQILSSAGSRD